MVEVGDEDLCQGLLSFNNSGLLPKLEETIDLEDLLKILGSSGLLPLLLRLNLADPCRCLATFPEALVQVVVVQVLEGESSMSLRKPPEFRPPPPPPAPGQQGPMH